MRRKLALLLSALLLITLAGCYNYDTDDYIAPSAVPAPTAKPIETLPTTSDGSFAQPTPKDANAIQMYDYIEDFQGDSGLWTMWYDEENDWTVRLMEYIPETARPEKIFQIGDEVVQGYRLAPPSGVYYNNALCYTVNGVTITQNPEDAADMIRGPSEYPEYIFNPDAPEEYTLRDYYYYIIVDMTITNVREKDKEDEKDDGSTEVSLNDSRFYGMTEELGIIESQGAWNTLGISDFNINYIVDANISQHPTTNSFFHYTFQPKESLRVRLLTFANDKALTDFDLCLAPSLMESFAGPADDFIMIHERSQTP